MTDAHVLDRISAPAKNPSLCKDRTKQLISAGIHRAVSNHGLDAVAQAAECHSRTIHNAMSMETVPELHTLGNLLRLEPTFLGEWLGVLGFKIVSKEAASSPDQKLVAEVSKFLTEFLTAIEDGRRTPPETVRLANRARTVIHKLESIVSEADEHRTGRA